MESYDKTPEELTAEKVALRLEGKKQFTYFASETVYYEVVIYAKDREEADREYYQRDIMDDDITHSTNFTTDDVTEEEINE